MTSLLSAKRSSSDASLDSLGARKNPQAAIGTPVAAGTASAASLDDSVTVVVRNKGFKDEDGQGSDDRELILRQSIVKALLDAIQDSGGVDRLSENEYKKAMDDPEFAECLWRAWNEKAYSSVRLRIQGAWLVSPSSTFSDRYQESFDLESCPLGV